MFWTTPGGQFVFVNDAMCQQLGYTREELLGMTIYDIDPTLPKGWMGDWEELKRQGSVTHETSIAPRAGWTSPWRSAPTTSSTTARSSTSSSRATSGRARRWRSNYA